MSFCKINKASTFFLLIWFIFNSCNQETFSSNHIPIDISKIKGTWWRSTLNISSVKNGTPINIDTTYTKNNFNMILTILTDTMIFYEKKYLTICDSLPTLRTSKSINQYLIKNDTLTFWSNFYEMQAFLAFNNDTLIQSVILDSHNPGAAFYGYGMMVNKFIKYSGQVPPVNWPPSCP